MTPRSVRVRHEAALDLLTAALWYETQRQGLGIEFREELAKLIESLSLNSLLYKEVHRGQRRAFARRFPYAVYYRVSGDLVVVTAVLHVRRNAAP